jgi:uncharacterized membrane protein YqhA
MLTRLFSYTRYLLFIPVLGALVASVVVLLFGATEVVRSVLGMLNGDLMVGGTKPVLLKFIEIIDLFLIGTVFYITSLGLYELFIDEKIPTPAWLEITHLDDLKAKLLNVVVVILGVVFLGQVINWKAGPDILTLGAGIGLVILSVTYFLRKNGGHSNE